MYSLQSTILAGVQVTKEYVNLTEYYIKPQRKVIKSKYLQEIVIYCGNNGVFTNDRNI